MDTVDRPRRSLEELVDQLMAAMGFKEQEPETASATEIPSVAKSVHEARRLRQAGDVDGALAVLAGVDAEKAETKEARWAFSEWTQLVKRPTRNHLSRPAGPLRANASIRHPSAQTPLEPPWPSRARRRCLFPSHQSPLHASISFADGRSNPVHPPASYESVRRSPDGYGPARRAGRGIVHPASEHLGSLPT